MDKIQIPNRFESVLEEPRFRENIKALIWPVEDDLRRFEYLRDLTTIQSGGVLAFLKGRTGIGKTTAVYAASIYLPEIFDRVVLVSPDLDLRDVVSWLKGTLPQPGSKALLVLFDGREITDDTVGLKQFLAGLNQLLRRRKDIVFVWPTTDESWYKQVREQAVKIGGGGFSPNEGVIDIQGPPKDVWEQILERFLVQLDLTLSDVALSREYLDKLSSESLTLGNYLEKVGRSIAERVTGRRQIESLPTILFVVSSVSNRVIGEANRIRRAKTQILKAEELIAYSPRSEAGKWWSARLDNPEHHLAYVIALFNARLLTLTHSAVVYSCLHYGSPFLQQVVKDSGLQPHSGNAEITFKRTDFYRFLIGENLTELTSTRKGRPGEKSLNAFVNVQRLSSKHHKEINMAICQSLLSYLTKEDVDASVEGYEVNAGGQNLYTDAIIAVNRERLYLEFHHLGPDNCKASKMASYIMGKLRSYALHYNLIPR